MAPEALGGMKVGEGPCERQEGSGQSLGVRHVKGGLEIADEEATQDLAQLTWRNSGSGDGNTLEVAVFLVASWGKPYFSASEKAGMEEC